MIELQMTFSEFLETHDERSWEAWDLMHGGSPLNKVFEEELTDCSECDGNGYVYGFKGYVLECPKCEGYGDEHKHR